MIPYESFTKIKQFSLKNNFYFLTFNSIYFLLNKFLKRRKTNIPPFSRRTKYFVGR